MKSYTYHFLDNFQIHCLLIRLVHDREVQLYDGTRLIKHDSYDYLLSNGQTTEKLAKNGIFRIHPSFRIVALAEPPSGEFDALKTHFRCNHQKLILILIE